MDNQIKIGIAAGVGALSVLVLYPLSVFFHIADTKMGVYFAFGSMVVVFVISYFFAIRYLYPFYKSLIEFQKNKHKKNRLS